MSQENQITVRFKAAGHKELKAAIDQLHLAQVRLEKGAREYERQAKKINKESLLGVKNNRLLGNSFATLRSKMLLASFGAGLFASSIGRLAKLYGEQERAQQKLSIQLGGTSSRLLEFASAQQQVTRFGDEVTISAMATAAAYTKNQGEIEELTKVAMDYAVFSGQDLNSAVELVSKSIFSSTNALSRYGIQFTGTAGTADRFNNALDAIREKAGGLAEGEAGTLNFALDQMGNAIGDLGENIGSIFVPSIIVASKALKEISEFLDEERVKSYAAAIGGAGVVFITYKGIVERAAIAQAVFNKAVAKSILGFAALVVVGEAIKHLEIFKDTTKDVNDVLDQQLTKTQQQILADQKYAMSAEKLLIAQEGLSDIQGKSLILDLKKVQLGEQLNAGIIDQITFNTKLNELLVEGINLEEDKLNAQIRAAQQSISAVDGAISAIEANGSAFLQAEKQKELATAKSQSARDAINEKYAKLEEQRAKKLRTFKVASAISNVALGITQTFADKNLPTLAKFIIAAAQATAGAAQIATIQGQKFEQGGLVGGRRHSQGGTMIEAEQGEFVMSRRAVESVGIETMNRINQGGNAGNVNVSFTGNVMSQDFIEDEAIPMIKEANRRGADIGVS